MSYRALYLKYRPQTFGEVAGQKAVVKTLEKSLSSGKIGHAYLFSGPRGTGKTSMARLFAKALDCEKGVGSQCGECENCRLIAEGGHPDVIEIDAASNNGVDQVRELIDHVGYAPIKSRYKVYILDEVHMMTAAAVNALLKTLEEPPENVIFILCTTEPHKVLPTILSRCQRYEFHKLSDEEMRGKLEEVLVKEGAGYEGEAIDAVIDLADGGMRDCLSIADQMLAYSGNSLNIHDLLSVYGLTSKEEKIALLMAIAGGNASEVIGRCESYLAGGIDLRRLSKDLVQILRDALIYEKTKDASLLGRLEEEECKRLLLTFGPHKAEEAILALVEAESLYSRVDDVRNLFELTLLRMTDGEGLTRKAASPKEEERKEETLKAGPLPKEEPRHEIPAPKAEVPPAPRESPIDLEGFGSAPLLTEGEEYQLAEEDLIKVMNRAMANKREKAELSRKWELLAEIQDDPNAGLFATLLLNGKPYALSDECLLVQFDHPTDARKANIKGNQAQLRKLVGKLLGHEVFLYALRPEVRGGIYMKFNSLKVAGILPSIEEAPSLPKD